MADFLSSILGGPLAAPSTGGGLFDTTNPSTDFALSLLANSGPTRLPTTFGQAVGQSAIQAQDMASQAAMRRTQLAQAYLGLQSAAARQGIINRIANGGGSQPAQPDMSAAPVATNPAPPINQPPPLIAAPGYQPSQTPQPAAPQPTQRVLATNTDSPLLKWLIPPPQSAIAQSPIGPAAPNDALALAVSSGKDLATAQAAIRAQQLAQFQQQYAGQIQTLNGVAQSDSPTRDVRANPMLTALWQQYAGQRGLNPSLAGKDFTDANLRQVFGGAANQFRAALSEPVVAPPIHLTAQGYDPVTGQYKGPEPKAVLGADGNPVYVSPADAIGKKPYNQWAITSDQMQGAVGALDAALTQSGVSIPGGGRGGQLYVAKLKNLIAANPGQTAQQIAQQLRTGQLDFNGAKRSTSQLATVAAAADAQSRQLGKNFAAMDPLVSKMDATGVPIVNRAVAQLRQNWQAHGDKDTSEFIGYLRATAGEYAKIQSGGTGTAAPGEAEWRSSMDYMLNAYATGGYQGMKTAITTEATNKRASYAEGLQYAARPGAGVGANPTGAAATTPVRISSDADYNRLASGATFIAPDGTTRRKP